jgi:hypothetical protein
MSKALYESLKMDLPALAEMLRSKGRGKDTILAHITPKEAALLKRRGGSGTTNPDTGLPEFEDFGGDYSVAQDVAPQAPVYDIVQPGGAFTQVGGGTGQQYTPGGTEYAPTTTPTFNIDTYSSQGQPSVGLPGNVPQGQELPTGGTLYAPTTLTPYQLGQAAVGQQVEGYPGPSAEAPTKTTTKPDEGFGTKDLARLGIGTTVLGGLTAANLARTRQAAAQAQQAGGELSALGAPYKTSGTELVRAAQAGELSPVNQQVLKAAQAQGQQAIATRGGVGQQQYQNSIADLTARLLQNQYDLGLKVMNIGDQYAAGAIRTSLQADQAIGAANQQFYTALAQMSAPFLLGQAPVYTIGRG